MDKKNTFKQIISDFLDRELTSVYSREYDLPFNSNKIISVIGPRRAGKTHVLFNLIKELRNTLPNERLVYINFEDDRLFPMRLEDMDIMIKGYYELYPDNKDHTVYFFLDEIQEVPNWEKFIRRIHDQENCRIYLTGSSSKMLSREIATALRGRTITFEIFPLSFSEFLQFKGINVNPNTSKGEATLVHESWSYLRQGGFPELIFSEPRFHKKIIEEYLDLMIYKDLTERFSIHNTYLIKYLLKHFLVNIANPITITKTYNDLRSQGLKISKNTVFEYTSHLEEAYLIFTAKLFTSSVRKQAVNPTKIYGIDPAFKHAVSISEDWGRLLENMVYLHLRRKGISPSYILSHQEVDFYWEGGQLINASIDVSNPSTYYREITGLISAMKSLGVNDGKVITMDYLEVYKERDIKIEFIPFWKFVFDL
ncbi:MAG: ATP-binding protein [Saprospiraceae bacterium]|nr:ATP-binding protein [Saprospiraceae bacterium]